MDPLADLRAALRARVGAMMRAEPAHDMAHLDRVWADAARIARDEDGVDGDVLLAACYLHDLVNLPKSDPRRGRASRRSARAAMPVLEALNIAAEKRDAICHAIEAHSYSAGIAPETPEAAILRDADRLDALGAVGIARTFVVAGQSGTCLYDPDDPFARERPLDDTRFALDHWQIKLLALPKAMTTRSARVLADERVEVMRRYLRDLATEIGSPLPGSLRLRHTGSGAEAGQMPDQEENRSA